MVITIVCIIIAYIIYCLVIRSKRGMQSSVFLHRIMNNFIENEDKLIGYIENKAKDIHYLSNNDEQQYAEFSVLELSSAILSVPELNVTTHEQSLIYYKMIMEHAVLRARFKDVVNITFKNRFSTDISAIAYNNALHNNLKTYEDLAENGCSWE